MIHGKENNGHITRSSSQDELKSRTLPWHPETINEHELLPKFQGIPMRVASQHRKTKTTTAWLLLVLVNSFSGGGAAGAKETPFSLPLCPAVKPTTSKPASIQPTMPAPVRLPVPSNPDIKPVSKTTSIEQAQSLNLMPLALLPDKAEVDRLREVSLDLESKELTALWSATIDRSPDIQFVINLLQPNSDRRHAASTAGKYLGRAFSEVMRATPMLTPTMPGKLATGAISSAFDQAISGKQSGLSEQQTIALYKMVRDIADRLVDSYRSYKLEIGKYDLLSEELLDQQTLAIDNTTEETPGKAFDREFSIRQTRRQLQATAYAAEVHRRQLQDLAGVEAVGRLDDQIVEERQILSQLGIPAGRPLLTPPTNSARN